jgi:hypothetical protein
MMTLPSISSVYVTYCSIMVSVRIIVFASKRHSFHASS